MATTYSTVNTNNRNQVQADNINTNSTSPQRSKRRHSTFHTDQNQHVPTTPAIFHTTTTTTTTQNHSQSILTSIPKHERRMSLPTLIQSLGPGGGKGKQSIMNWHSKVLAHKVSRNKDRAKAINTAKNTNLQLTKRKSLINFDGIWHPNKPTSPTALSPNSSSNNTNAFFTNSDSETEEPETDMRTEGNLHFYHDENLLKREHLRNHVGVLKAIDVWWDSFVLPTFDDDGDGNIQRSEYRGLYRILLHSLTKLFRLRKKKSGRLAEKKLLQEEQVEWERDSKGSDSIDRDQFRTVMFELVDIWCDSISSVAYIKLTNSIFETALKLHPKKKNKTITKKKQIGAPTFSNGSNRLIYRSYNVYEEVLKREKAREDSKNKVKLTWNRGIKRLKAHGAMRSLINSLKRKSELEHEHEHEYENKKGDGNEKEGDVSVGIVNGIIDVDNDIAMKDVDDRTILADQEIMSIIGDHHSSLLSKSPLSIEERRSPSPPVSLSLSLSHSVASSRGHSPTMRVVVIEEYGSPIRTNEHTLQPWDMPNNFVVQERLSPTSMNGGNSEKMNIIKSKGKKNKSKGKSKSKSKKKIIILTGKKKKKKKKLIRPKSALHLRSKKQRGLQLNVSNYGRLSGSMSMRDLKRFADTKGRTPSNKIIGVYGLREKKQLSISIEGDALKTRQTLNFVERMGGIQTRLTAAGMKPKLK